MTYRLTVNKIDFSVTKGVGTNISFEKNGEPSEAFDSPDADNIIELNGMKSELTICISD